MSIVDKDLPELADEYVLGLLEPDEAREVDDRLASDAALADTIAKVRERYLALDDTASSVVPSPELWQRIQAAIASGAVAPTGQPPRTTAASRTTARGRARGSTGERRSGRGARLAAITSLAASLVLAVALGWALFLRPEPAVVAALVDDEGEVVALIESSPDNQVQVTLLDDVVLGTDRVLQVWTKPDPDGPPVSLGTIERVASETLKLAGYPPPSDDQLYEITIERAGGSPTGLPTGPIVGKGFAKEPF